ncbi:MAG TPA: DUF3552 domain-containing protein, partial [Planctomycetaceae bacterium]|nr:DUF3552 domain-containing protein [Planctomycetaceae bacterium]
MFDPATMIIAVIALGVGALVGYVVDRIRLGATFQRRDEIIRQAEREAENIRRAEELAAKEALLKRREELEAEIGRTREELRAQQKQVDQRETKIEQREQDLAKKERMLEITQKKLAERAKVVEARDRELERVLREEQEQLHRISGLDEQAAKEMLLNRLERRLKEETGALILKYRKELKDKSRAMAREIIGMAIQRCASNHTSETTVSSVDIPNDEMKGRIIGREGRNIRAFE